VTVEALGLVFLFLIALVVLLAVLFVIVALPDVSRYRRLRRM
jgi:hypothetical protein